MTVHAPFPPSQHAASPVESGSGRRTSPASSQSLAPQAGLLAGSASFWPDLEPLRRGTPGDAERVTHAARHLSLGNASIPAGELADSAALLEKWRWLAQLGRYDLVVGRLSEGHADAAGILAEAGRHPQDGALYGVWASASGGTGVTATPTSDGWQLTGGMRFCTGATTLDRALITARTPDGDLLLLDVEVRSDGWTPIEGTWPAVGMDLSESLDVRVDAAVPSSALVGGPGFYLDRPGFALGGIGVAAVWIGGAAGVLDTIADGLHRFEPDPHQLAHLGTMGTAVLAAADVLSHAAQTAPHQAAAQLPALALRARSTAEEAARIVLDRAPRLTGPTPLCRDADYAHRIADLLVYVRQHHAERDLAALGTKLLAEGPFGTSQSQS